MRTQMRDSRDKERPGKSGDKKKKKTPRAADRGFLVWSCCYEARPVPSCLSYRCHLAPDNDQTEGLLPTDNAAVQRTA